ncbi:MAG TPA: DUF5666 domain-containing protein [Vicinamibacteria bacterium]|nr:DUF5666 domain-containing protein [Vicinamibacteria bacterium]
MHRRLSLRSSLAGLAAALCAAGCGGSSAATGPDRAAPAATSGAAVLQGTILGTGLAGTGTSVGAPVHALAGDTGWSVSIAGTSLAAAVDEDGRFTLSGVPAGSVGLRVEGPGVSAQVQVTGLVDRQVTSVEVRISGGAAQLTTPPTCAPTADTFFSGTLDQMAGTQLVVAGRPVDASQVQKVWRGDRRIQLSDLQVGEKVKVWGTLRGDGVVVAEEIAALTTGPGGSGGTWVSFKGVVQSVASLGAGGGVAALDEAGVHRSCDLRLTVAGRDVETNGSTVFKWSDGSALDPYAIVAGDVAAVGGWSKPEGYVLATKIVVDNR